MTHRRTIFLIALSAVILSPAFATAGQFRAVASAFAVVDSDGTLVRGRNATTAAHQGNGLYEVNFDHNVSRCVFTASLTAPNAGDAIAPGSVTVAGLSGVKSGVYVETYDTGGVPADRAFSLSVRCLKEINT